MSVRVAFIKFPNVGGYAGLVYGPCRTAETIALNATTAITALEGEWAVLTSTETAVINAASGTTPDAAATAATAATQAGVNIPIGIPTLMRVCVGDKIQVKAFS